MVLTVEWACPGRLHFCDESLADDVLVLDVVVVVVSVVESPLVAPFSTVPIVFEVVSWWLYQSDLAVAFVG